MRNGPPLHSCPSCDGLVPNAASACPHCGLAASEAGKLADKAAEKREPQATANTAGTSRTNSAAVSGARASKWTGRAAVAIAGAGFAVTLMACYGPPPREYEKADAPPPSPKGSTSSMPLATPPTAPNPAAPDMPKAK